VSSVDVIVPCYRYGHFLRQSVESVLAQRDISVRVLIIDDASPDCTAEVATQLSSEDSESHLFAMFTTKATLPPIAMESSGRVLSTI
jgi:glycosyltransferase involved in cell wall biosynthesis